MRKNKIIISLCLVVVLVLTGGCTQDEVKQIEGILQNVDVANGEITIVTKDGQTMTFDIDTDALVESEGVPSTLDTLEVGASIQVEVSGDDKVVRRIKAQQTDEEAEEDKEDGEDVEVGEEVVVDEAVKEMEAERARLAEEIRIRVAAGEVDAEWVREVEAERARLAEEIRRLQEGGNNVDPPETINPSDPVDDEVITTISGEIQAIDGNLWTIIVNGKSVVIDVSNLDIGTTPVVGSAVTISGVQSGDTIVAKGVEVDDGDDVHPGDDDVHPGDDDGHPDDDDGHPDDDDGHPDDGEDDHPE